MPYLTPDAAAGDYACRRITVPVELLHIVSGALETLTHPGIYEPDGTMTPEEAASFMLRMFTDMLTSEGACMSVGIGRIEYYCNEPVDEVAAGLLLMADGNWHARADYPEYMAWLAKCPNPTLYHRGTASFATPFLTSTFIKSEGIPDIGAGGGADHITLTVANLPAHTHTEIVTGLILAAVGPGEVPVVTAGAPGVTGSTGGGTQFDNRPHYINELAYVRVR